MTDYFEMTPTALMTSEAEMTAAVPKMVELGVSSKLDNTPLKDLPLTMAYVPMQKYSTVYDQAEALNNGTLFPDLDKPFSGKFVK
ncbi:MAG: spore coat associated protein CotJA [Oscillospiraceae bacterium]|nr:spore coat associated protein CotJA [Oscillospiraceae bacterium]